MELQSNTKQLKKIESIDSLKRLAYALQNSPNSYNKGTEDYNNLLELNFVLRDIYEKNYFPYIAKYKIALHCLESIPTLSTKETNNLMLKHRDGYNYIEDIKNSHNEIKYYILKLIGITH